MEWIKDLLWGEGIGHSLLLLAFTVAAGIQLGKIKVFGISLGVTWVLFVGIMLGHFGFCINPAVIHFFQEFGLILFVYSVGMQVGPGFFSSFKRGGMTLNGLACGIVFLGVATALVIHFVAGIPIPAMVGILSGAVTNTPGLGAAQQAYTDMTGSVDESIALGYAVAYPLGVIGIILAMLFIRYVFHVSFDDEAKKLEAENDTHAIKTFIGEEIQMDRKQWIPAESQFVSRRILVTRPELTGRRLGDLQLRRLHGINVTRVNRAGLELVATQHLQLQVGDRVTVVGSELAVDKVSAILGNSMKRLNEPNLITIFIGIALGIILGSIPFSVPGIPQPIKLGLAGGPLIVAILISRFGYRYRLVTYTTQSANLMLREIGITIFLACVGLNAGSGFIDTIVNKGGVTWIGYGFIITMLPLLVIGLIGRYYCKLNYFTLIGLLAGSTTDPPALAYANATAGNDAPAVSYATVYPLTMFLRVLTAQLMILFFYT